MDIFMKEAVGQGIIGAAAVSGIWMGVWLVRLLWSGFGRLFGGRDASQRNREEPTLQAPKSQTAADLREVKAALTEILRRLERIEAAQVRGREQRHPL